MARKRTNIKEKYIVGSNAVAYDYIDESSTRHDGDQVTSENTNRKGNHNFKYTLVLITMMLLMMFVCVLMLKSQFTVANTSKEVILLRNQLTEVRRENAHLESIVKEELDLVEIKRLAIEEYGMVYPSEDEVIKIAPSPSSYTVQYGTIEAPKREKISISNVLAFMTRGW